MSTQKQTPVVAVMEPSSGSLDEFRRSFKSAPQDFIFACGGSIPIDTQATPSTSSTPSVPSVPPPSLDGSQPIQTQPAEKEAAEKQPERTVSSSPVTLRWDSGNPSALASECKLTMPLRDGQQNNLAGLLRDMEPATFGLGSKDVYDESYRKASKMDVSQFASTFNPYELGIVDVVAQMLLPNLQIGRAAIPTLKRGVRAELYKLNVYSGPSGLFRAHVDTPRSVDQFGSLVVCLPLVHTGGQLKVQYQGRDVVFDWGTSEEGAEKAPAIQWAAFYSDCLHEVLEVKSGHRITLTYNLFATYGGGAITGLSNAVDMTNLPIYKNLSGLLNLLPGGGYIGFCTTHSYPHSSNHSCLPHTLKGADGMAVWEILHSLGCSVGLKPIVKVPRRHYDEDEDEGDEDDEGDDDGQNKALRNSFIGWDLGPDMLGSEEDRTLKSMVLEDWAMLQSEDVYWLNKLPNEYEEQQISYVAYGNQSSAEIVYSACVIFAQVPEYTDGQNTDSV